MRGKRGKRGKRGMRGNGGMRGMRGNWFPRDRRIDSLELGQTDVLDLGTA